MKTNEIKPTFPASIAADTNDYAITKTTILENTGTANVTIYDSADLNNGRILYTGDILEIIPDANQVVHAHLKIVFGTGTKSLEVTQMTETKI